VRIPHFATREHTRGLPGPAPAVLRSGTPIEAQEDMTRSTSLLAMALVIMIFTGCSSSTVSLKPEDVAHLKAVPEIPAVHGQPAKLRVMTLGRTLGPGLFGIVGGVVAEGLARSDGKSIVDTYGLEDPAGRVKDRLITALAERLTLDNVRAVAAPVEDIDAKTLRATYQDAVVLAVQTDQWTLGYLDLASHYAVMYGATARLVRTSDGTVPSNATCRLDGKQFPQLTMNELKANNGAQLKRRLENTADLCVERLIAELAGQGLAAAASK
jgi:hypothetical protein